MRDLPTCIVVRSDRLDTVDYPNGMTVDYDYFPASGDFLLKQIKNLSSGTTPTVISQFDYTYRQDRNIETWSIQQGGSAETWTFDYDPEMQLKTAARRNSAQTILENLRYGYDASGNRNSVTENGATTNYATNNLNQLTQARGFGPTLFSGTLDEPASVTVNGQTAQIVSDGGNAPYTFEALVDLAEGSNTVTIEATDGNSNTRTHTYVVTVGGVLRQLEYDLNGNLRFERDALGAVLREFQWDQLNRLVRIIDPAGGGTGGTRETEFVYDGFDRRVRFIERENGVEQSNHVYIWADDRIVQKRNSAATTVARNYFNNGFTEGANSYFCTKDHLGSIREVVAADGSTIEACYEYTAWGEVTKIGGTGVESDFLYTGHFFHAESGLFLAKYRAYDSELGRWLSRDPVGFIDGPNLYAYVFNEPIGRKDYLGLFFQGFGVSPGSPAPPGLAQAIASQPHNSASSGHALSKYYRETYLEPMEHFLDPAVKALQGGFAFADRVFPLLTPLSDLGLYDECDSSLKISQNLGDLATIPASIAVGGALYNLHSRIAGVPIGGLGTQTYGALAMGHKYKQAQPIIGGLLGMNSILTVADFCRRNF